MSLSIEVLSEIKGPILILGERGSGKSFLAKKIHEFSALSNGPFIHINMAGLNDELFDELMFGHAKGTFTGAYQNTEGFVTQVGEGTLFLDEIGDLSLKSQRKLLMLLEEKIYYVLGKTTPFKFKGKVIAATNACLEQLCEEKLFRKDLFDRLQVYKVQVSPLKKRRKLIEELIGKFFLEACKDYQRANLLISNDLFEHLINHPWPGNIRQLKNCIEYLVGVCPKDDKMIDSINLPDWFWEEMDKELAIDAKVRDVEASTWISPYSEGKGQFEKQYLSYYLSKNSGKINQTASYLKISKATLIAKIRKYGINTERYKL